MTLQDMYFVFRDGECVYQALTLEQAMRHIRGRLSGPKHKENKGHRWTWQQGLGPFRCRS